MTQAIQELLPFYVNGTLDEAERLAVEAALKKTPALQKELDYLQSLRMEMRKMEREHGPGELGLKRLQKSLAAEKLKSDPIERARSRIAAEQSWRWKALAVAACLLLVIQTVIALPHWQAGDLGAAGGPVAAVQEPLFSVTFVPDAKEADIRALLTELDLEIVGGPSALGVYQLSGGGDATLERLQNRPDLVDSAQVEKP